MYLHPRQIINDLNDGDLSDQSMELKVLKRLGIDPDKYNDKDFEHIKDRFMDKDKYQTQARIQLRDYKKEEYEQKAMQNFMG